MFLVETDSVKIRNSGLQNVLKSGSSVFFFVKKQINSNKYTIVLNGKSINVKSSSELVEGSRQNAKVLWTKSGLTLKIFDKKNSSVERRTDTYSLLGNTGKMITNALIRSNMPLNPEYIEKILTILKKTKKTDSKYLKTIILLIDKGIPVTEKNINEIMLYSNHFRDNFLNEKKDSAKRKASKDNAGIDEIKEDIKKQINSTDTGNELLKYFNHKIAKHDNWIIIPVKYSFKRDGVGVLKLQLDEKYKILNLVLSLNDSFEWDFSLKRVQNDFGMEVSGSSEFDWEKSLPFRKLKEKLHKIGIRIDDINNEISETDGFRKTNLVKYNSVDFIA
jgi:hypothetical protein